MSFIRYSSDYEYVEGGSDDYIFLTDDKDGNEYVEDYGHIRKNTMVELIAHLLFTDCQRESCEDATYKKYLVQKLAEKLKVNLRE